MTRRIVFGLLERIAIVLGFSIVGGLYLLIGILSPARFYAGIERLGQRDMFPEGAEYDPFRIRGKQ